MTERTLPSATAQGNERFTVVWHWPTADDNKKLTVHGEHHWTKRSRIAKRWRETAELVCRSARCPVWKRAEVRFRFYKPTARICDQLNQAQRMKHVIDGICKAGLLPDDNDKYLSVGGMESFIDRENPRIEIEFVRRA